jgi:hypothetical protein
MGPNAKRDDSPVALPIVDDMKKVSALLQGMANRF